MERVVFDRMAELDQEHWWFVARRKILARLIARVVRPPTPARLLEIGCGTGHNLAMIGQFGELEAGELDPAARALSSARLGKPVRDCELPDLDAFAPDSFDMIALLDVLEHVPDDGSALAAIHQRLRPGGALLLTVPANPWMWSAHDVAHHHFRRYTKGGLDKLARDCGFEVQLLSHFNSLLFPLIAATRLIGKLRPDKSADDALPGAVLNATLRGIFGFEAGLVGRVPMPFGVSLVAVLRRPR
jgi:SAM-dependent methyltransferase